MVEIGKHLKSSDFYLISDLTFAMTAELLISFQHLS